MKHDLEKWTADQHRELAKEAAVRSIVLLKNENRYCR